MNFKIFFSYFMLVSLFTQAGGIKTDNDSTEKLSKRMNTFFAEVLRNNYQATNEQDLYQHFLVDYFEAWTDSGHLGLPDLKLKVDSKKLTEINNDLFKRDLSHYYYFFPEVILLKQEDNMPKAKELFKRYPKIPIVIIKTKSVASKHTLKYTNFYESHNVHLAFPGGYIKDIQKYDLETVAYVNKTMETVREIPFFNIATFLTKSEAKHELKIEVVREIVAIIFWKYLCLQAGVDFYALPKDCDKSFQY